jgi:hypothetical protein
MVCFINRGHPKSLEEQITLARRLALHSLAGCHYPRSDTICSTLWPRTAIAGVELDGLSERSLRTRVRGKATSFGPRYAGALHDDLTGDSAAKAEFVELFGWY